MVVYKVVLLRIPCKVRYGGTQCDVSHVHVAVASQHLLFRRRSTVEPSTSLRESFAKHRPSDLRDTSGKLELPRLQRWCVQ